MSNILHGLIFDQDSDELCAEFSLCKGFATFPRQIDDKARGGANRRLARCL
ncbi:hypothetical protein MU852_07245 [Brevundimonas albigilva]|uniref:Uncharacterized protein n=1 Tax=Brevundimonas albigilva TaxID=1312364 RepID=A0ABY4SPM9_9CAUL|nr:hypothetical protein [Brevundimonas albigilva]UQV19545.1 hypothetical protein MU852_07245 [Brevundimonas albigilva]URI15547.1 hypothetical protein M8231_00695 [Brevundimonas albigilva]